MPGDLTSKSFAKLLGALSADKDEAAILYTRLHRSLVRFFHLKGLSEPDKAADETIDRVAEKLEEEREVEDVKKFTFGVARYVFLEKYRHEKVGSLVIDKFYLKKPENEFRETDEFEPLRKCFNKLYEHERDLLLRYFQDLSAEELHEIRQKFADEEGISLNSLRIRVMRLRKRLEDCLRGMFS